MTAPKVTANDLAPRLAWTLAPRNDVVESLHQQLETEAVGGARYCDQSSLGGAGSAGNGVDTSGATIPTRGSQAVLAAVRAW